MEQMSLYNVSCLCCSSSEERRNRHLGPYGPELRSSKLPVGPWKSEGSQGYKASLFGKSAFSRHPAMVKSRGGPKTPPKPPILCDSAYDRHEMKIANGPKAPAIGFQDMSNFGCQTIAAASSTLVVFFDHSPNAKESGILIETPKRKAKHQVTARSGGA
eukprot:gnl/MRDRNA2_/MRDRNA2_122369_c0_seq1.p1 gnl/MRDRNA2_/MRDRNA2_122369_c0~~gnl/MRDRNA2_/MRDRNA2_122369_c0_seq1.p1  ORF type:complete len:159 (-),score=21.09 gnl/MRDRNA2_/MRDRNA2_122369_c0_seq1:46-522(-)